MGCFQMNKEDFKAEGFEVSRPRAHYGNEKLGVTIYSDIKELKGFTM